MFLSPDPRISPVSQSSLRNFGALCISALSFSSRFAITWELSAVDSCPSPSPLESALRALPASVDSKPLTATVSPLEATLTKNRGEGPFGPPYRCTFHPKVPESRLLLLRRQPGKHLRSTRCLSIRERRSGPATANCRPRSQVAPGNIGIALARRPGSNVLRMDLSAGWPEQFSRAGKVGSVRMGRRPFMGPR